MDKLMEVIKKAFEDFSFNKVATINDAINQIEQGIAENKLVVFSMPELFTEPIKTSEN